MANILWYLLWPKPAYIIILLEMSSPYYGNIFHSSGGGRRPCFFWEFPSSHCVACGGVPLKIEKYTRERYLWCIKYPLFIWLDVYINGRGLTRVRQQRRAQTLLGAERV